jgi:type IV secretory pathway VirB4 component
MNLFNKKSSAEEAASESAKKKTTKKSVKGLARTVQDVLQIDGITNNGIVIYRNQYSKLYHLIDSNFVSEPDDVQEELLKKYTQLVNRFMNNITISVVIINKANTMADMSQAYHIKEKGDSIDEYREAYNAIIDEKITEGRNDITKEKYIMLTATEASLSDAETTFNTVEPTLQEAVKAINKNGVVPVEAVERLSILREILNGSKVLPFEKEYDRFIIHTNKDGENDRVDIDKLAMEKAGYSIKDLVAPQCIMRSKKNIVLNEKRYCKSYAYNDFPQSIDTSFLTKTTNLPTEMVTVIQMKAIPRKKSIALVKNMNTSVKADVMKESKKAYKGGYDPSLMNDDLLVMRDETHRLRHDVVVEGKKLFLVTSVITIFAENEKDLQTASDQFSAICGDYTITPSYLIGQQVQGLNTACLTSTSKIIVDRLLTSDNVQALFPFNIQELQDRNGYFYGINAISKNMIMYSRKYSKLANGIIVGQSGSGKSFATKGEMIVNMLSSDDQVIVLDPENEYRVIANALGGTVIDLELKSEYTINPCDMSMEWDDPKATPLAEKCDYMVGLVESILGRGRECNSFEVNAIHKATTQMYESYIDTMTHRHEEGDKRDIDTEICPTLADFYECLIDMRTPEAVKVATAIEPYCVGQYNVFAKKTNVPVGNRMIVYNLLSLPEKMKEMAMKVCLSNIWTRIVKNREYNEKYKMNRAVWVYLDEFHLFFQTQSSADTIMAYYKRVRKYGGIMTGITQDVADLLRSSQGTAMFNNTGFFMFFNQSPIGRQQIQQIYAVSDTLIDYIKDRPAGQGLLYNGTVMIPFDYKLPTENVLYKLMSTNPNDMAKGLSYTAADEEDTETVTE